MIGALSTALSGLLSASQRIDGAARNIANIGDGSGANTLPRDIIDIKLGEAEYKANLAVIKRTGEMQDQLLKAFDEKV